GAGGGAQRRGGIGRVEAHALPHQPVEVGRLDDGMAVGAGEHGDELVGHDDEKIRRALPWLIWPVAGLVGYAPLSLLCGMRALVHGRAVRPFLPLAPVAPRAGCLAPDQPGVALADCRPPAR